MLHGQGQHQVKAERPERSPSTITTNDNTGTIDDIRSTAITVNPAGIYSLSFDVAHKYYPSADSYDTLSVLISNNCGQTFTTVYKKWGPTLATAGQSTAGYADAREIMNGGRNL
jgi:hypothetical protein